MCHKGPTVIGLCCCGVPANCLGVLIFDVHVLMFTTVFVRLQLCCQFVFGEDK
jgi:hypothetical protein